MPPEIISVKRITDILSSQPAADPAAASRALARARAKKGLSLEETAALLAASGEDFEKELFTAAAVLKREIYGERIVFFAPLYISDYCINDCEYCNFHSRNTAMPRTRLSVDDVARQTEILISLGHKRILLESGESPETPADYIAAAVEKIYSVKTGKGNIRRVNVNISASSAADYAKLKSAGIGTYQLFQETYHPETYAQLHPLGPKADYHRQITAHNRAFAAGIDDVGIGVLFGLYDWRFEVLALVSHSHYLESTFGVGPHTISVPRFRPAESVAYAPRHQVSDEDFLKLIAVLRLAVPYTGMIISTRESAALRAKAFDVGISQASAGSVTTVGGYGTQSVRPQFSVSDDRPLSEVIDAALAAGLMPSFCTACYRSGRTGEKFMSLAKPAEIHKFCRPNGILTFAEYLADFAPPETRAAGFAAIEKTLASVEEPAMREKVRRRLERIKAGERDIYF